MPALLPPLHLTATTRREPLSSHFLPREPSNPLRSGGGRGETSHLLAPAFSHVSESTTRPSSLVCARADTGQDGEGECQHLYGTTCSRLPRWPRFCSTCALSLCALSSAPARRNAWTGFCMHCIEEGPCPALPSSPRAGGALGDDWDGRDGVPLSAGDQSGLMTVRVGLGSVACFYMVSLAPGTRDVEKLFGCLLFVCLSIACLLPPLSSRRMLCAGCVFLI